MCVLGRGLWHLGWGESSMHICTHVCMCVWGYVEGLRASPGQFFRSPVMHVWKSGSGSGNHEMANMLSHQMTAFLCSCVQPPSLPHTHSLLCHNADSRQNYLKWVVKMATMKEETERRNRWKGSKQNNPQFGQTLTGELSSWSKQLPFPSSHKGLIPPPHLSLPA